MTDTPGDRVAFLMHRPADAAMLPVDRLQIFALVDAHQSGDTPHLVSAEMRTVALQFPGDADYQHPWHPYPKPDRPAMRGTRPNSGYRAQRKELSMAETAVTARTWAYTVPGMRLHDAHGIVVILQERLDVLNELALTLKHVHWNVVGPHFIAVHTMIDPQVDTVREMVDALAERIATLGSSPNGLPGSMVDRRDWPDYELGRCDAIAHLRMLSLTYTRVIVGQRNAIAATTDDPVSQDLLTTHAADLEKFQWLVRAHSENESGELTW